MILSYEWSSAQPFTARQLGSVKASSKERQLTCNKTICAKNRLLSAHVKTAFPAFLTGRIQFLPWIVFHDKSMVKSAPIGEDFSVHILFCGPAAGFLTPVSITLNRITDRRSRKIPPYDTTITNLQIGQPTKTFTCTTLWMILAALILRGTLVLMGELSL